MIKCVAMEGSTADIHRHKLYAHTAFTKHRHRRRRKHRRTHRNRHGPTPLLTQHTLSDKMQKFKYTYSKATRHTDSSQSMSVCVPVCMSDCMSACLCESACNRHTQYVCQCVRPNSVRISIGNGYTHFHGCSLASSILSECCYRCTATGCWTKPQLYKPTQLTQSVE